MLKMSVQNVTLKNIQISFRVVGIGIKRDMVNITRYKVALIGWLINMFIGMGTAFVFGVITTFNPITTSETGISQTGVFVFFAGGVALGTFSDSALWAPLGRVDQDIHYGTLEAVFVTPANRLAYLISPILADSIINLLFFIPAYIIVMAANHSLTNLYVLGTTFLIVILTIFSMISFGVFFAMIAILVRKSRSLAIFLGNIFQFLCGAYVPVQAFVGIGPYFGTGLKYFAHLFPYTYCYDLFRYFTFGPSYKLLLPLWLEIVLLIVSSILFLVIASFLLDTVEKKAKKTGLSIL